MNLKDTEKWDSLFYSLHNITSGEVFSRVYKFFKPSFFRGLFIFKSNLRIII